MKMTQHANNKLNMIALFLPKEAPDQESTTGNVPIHLHNVLLYPIPLKGATSMATVPCRPQLDAMISSVSIKPKSGSEKP